MKSLTYLLSFLVEERSTICVIPTTPPFNSNHESISSSSLHTQIRKRRRPHRQSSSKAHPHNSIHPHTTPTRQKQHQKTNTSPTIPFHFRYPSSQPDISISTLKLHTTHSLSILIHTTSFSSIGIHQCILIKSISHYRSSLRIESTTPSPHSIHSIQYLSLLLEFKSIHFTLHS